MQKVALCILAAVLASSVGFATPGVVADISLSPVGSFKAKFSDTQGEAVEKGDTVTAENIVLNPNSIKTGIPLRDRHAKEKYLETDEFPTIILLNATGKDGKGSGRIKMKGIERDILGTYHISGGELTADFPVKPSDFNITGIKYLGIGVKDEVMVHVTVPVKKAADTLAPKK